MVACLKTLVERHPVHLTLVYEPAASEAPYAKFDLAFCENVIASNSKDFGPLLDKLITTGFDAVVMASWHKWDYMQLCRRLRKQGTVVISCFDRQWKGTIKQWVGVVSRELFLKPSIDNVWVPGDRQAEFARRLGFPNPLYGFYCANTPRFTPMLDICERPKKFIFVGRLIPEKGIDILLDAYLAYRSRVTNPWGLVIAGVGPYAGRVQDTEDVEYRGFTQPGELAGVFTAGQCFVLPSREEPWGVVLHEAAAAGLPIICSRSCGAGTWFVRFNVNGYIFDGGADRLAEIMESISNSSEEQIKRMSVDSLKLASLWSTERWADTLIDYLRQESKG
jgi:glycosyltransferase involved in cell wall biosynthesis